MDPRSVRAAGIVTGFIVLLGLSLVHTSGSQDVYQQKTFRHGSPGAASVELADDDPSSVPSATTSPSPAPAPTTVTEQVDVPQMADEPPERDWDRRGHGHGRWRR